MAFNQGVKRLIVRNKDGVYKPCVRLTPSAQRNIHNSFE